MISWMLGATFGMTVANLLFNPNRSWISWGLLAWSVVAPVWNWATWTVRKSVVRPYRGYPSGYGLTGEFDNRSK